MIGSVDEYLDWQDRQDESWQWYEENQALKDEMAYHGYHPHPTIAWLFVDENGKPVDEATAYEIYDAVIEEELGEWAQITRRKPNYLRLEMYRNMYKATAVGKNDGKP